MLVNITYDGNGATGTPDVTSESYPEGSPILLSGIGSLVKEGYTFAYWSLAVDGTSISYAAGEALTLGSTDLKFYAQWMLTITKIKGPVLDNMFIDHIPTATTFSDPAYADGMYYIGTNIEISSGISILETTGTEPVTNSVNISTVDGTTLPPFTVTLINVVNNDITYSVTLVSDDLSVLSYTYTPDLAVRSNFIAKANIVFEAGNAQISIFARSLPAVSDIVLTTRAVNDTLDFGNSLFGTLGFKVLTIAGITDTNLLSYKIINGDTNSFIMDFGNPFPNLTGGIDFAIYFTPTGSGATSETIQIQYGGMDIGAPLTLTGSCSDYVPPTITNAAPAQPTEVSVCYHNNCPTYLRIEGVNLVNNSTGEFELLNVDLALNHVLRPYAKLWFLVRYTPTSTVLNLPKLSITGTFF